MPRIRQPKNLELEPLIVYLGYGSDSEIGHRVGMAYQSVGRWRKHGIPYHTADRIAVSLGVHLVDIWGQQPELANQMYDRIDTATDRLRRLHDEIEARLDCNPDSTAYSAAWLAEIRDTLNETLETLSKV